MARVLGGGIRPYNTDGKKGLTIEGIDYVNIDGKLQTNDDRLLTTSKDIVGAINELFNLEPEGGDNWVYPADWLVAPEPASNQITMVVTSITANQLGFSGRDYYAPTTIDWGDGEVTTYGIGESVPTHTYVAGTGTIIDNGSEQWIVVITIGVTSIIYLDTNARPMLLALKIGSLFTPDSSWGYLSALVYLKVVEPDTFLPSAPNRMFYACYSLKKVEFGTPPTSIPNQCFGECLNLQSIDLSKATSIEDYAFGSCYNLKTVNAPLLISIGNNGVYNCYSLKTVNAPLLTSIGNNGFYNCYNLETVNSPLLTSIGENGFAYCYSLSSITYADGCTFGANAFQSCYNLYPIPV